VISAILNAGVAASTIAADLSGLQAVAAVTNVELAIVKAIAEAMSQ
jgi:hypothetical protein